MKHYLPALKAKGAFPEDFEARSIEGIKKSHYLVCAVWVTQDDIDPEKIKRRYSQIKVPVGAFQNFTHQEANKLFLLFSPENDVLTKSKFERVLQRHFQDSEKWEDKAGAAWEVVAAKEPSKEPTQKTIK